jgi:hypothetical protein
VVDLARQHRASASPAHHGDGERSYLPLRPGPVPTGRCRIVGIGVGMCHVTSIPTGPAAPARSSRPQKSPACVCGAFPVRSGGRKSNPQSLIETVVDLLLNPVQHRQRVRVISALAGDVDHALIPRAAPRLRQGLIQATVLAALREARVPLRARVIHAQVERRLGRCVSLDTVSSYLSVAARDAAIPVRRCSRGVYCFWAG